MTLDDGQKVSMGCNPTPGRDYGFSISTALFFVRNCCSSLMAMTESREKERLKLARRIRWWTRSRPTCPIFTNRSSICQSWPLTNSGDAGADDNLEIFGMAEFTSDHEKNSGVFTPRDTHRIARSRRSSETVRAYACPGERAGPAVRPPHYQGSEASGAMKGNNGWRPVTSFISAVTNWQHDLRTLFRAAGFPDGHPNQRVLRFGR